MAQYSNFFAALGQLGVKANNGKVDVWYQPTGGNVYEVKDYKLQGSHLILPLTQPQSGRPGMSWELDAAGDKQAKEQEHDDGRNDRCAGEHHNETQVQLRAGPLA